MTRRLLALTVVFGCASHQPASTSPADSTAQVDAAAAESGVCHRTSAVTVHVQNGSSMDVEIAFGAYTPRRPALGFAETTYRVARAYLTGTIEIRVVGGGLQIWGPARIPTEYVVCNDATLVIGSEPRYSIFYGDAVPTPTGKPKKDGDSTGTGPRGASLPR